MRVGIIGGGNIAVRHIEGYRQIDEVLAALTDARVERVFFFTDPF